MLRLFRADYAEEGADATTRVDFCHLRISYRYAGIAPRCRALPRFQRDFQLHATARRADDDFTYHAANIAADTTNAPPFGHRNARRRRSHFDLMLPADDILQHLFYCFQGRSDLRQASDSPIPRCILTITLMPASHKMIFFIAARARHEKSCQIFLRHF